VCKFQNCKAASIYENKKTFFADLFIFLITKGQLSSAGFVKSKKGEEVAIFIIKQKVAIFFPPLVSNEPRTRFILGIVLLKDNMAATGRIRI
jgi:hypothetical protein